MAFKMRSGNKVSFKNMGSAPAKQEKEKWESYYPLTEEEKNTPTEEELDQEKIDQQIKGTYVETEEDMKKRREEMENYAPRKKPPGKQRVTKEGEGKDQNKIFDEDGKHIGTYVNGKKVMKSTTSAHGQLSDAEIEYQEDLKRESALPKKDYASGGISKEKYFQNKREKIYKNYMKKNKGEFVKKEGIFVNKKGVSISDFLKPGLSRYYS